MIGMCPDTKYQTRVVFFMFRRILLGATATTGVGFTAAYNLDERVRRPVIIWKDLGPIILHYRLIELKHKYFPPATEELAASDYDELHQKYAEIGNCCSY